MKSYRNRIYDNYIHARAVPLAPVTLAGLQPRAAFLRRVIKQHFPQNKNAVILDLGCGHGAILYFAREAGYSNIRGVDISPQQVAAAKNLGIEGVERGDLILALNNLPDCSQDCVITFDLIEHFTREELIPLVDEVLRVLKPRGRWLIHTPNGESPFSNRMRYWDLTHELAFTRTSLAQLAFSSGFREVRSYEDTPIPHGVKSIIRWALWKILRYGLFFYILIETGSVDRNAIFTQNFLTVADK